MNDKSINKLLKYVEYGVGDTYVISKEDCVNILNNINSLSVNSMLAQLLKHNIEIENKDILEYSKKLNDVSFVTTEYFKLFNPIGN